MTNNNFEAEQAVLGHILNNGESIYNVPFLESDHFAEGLHGLIFLSMKGLAADGIEISPITLADKLADIEAFVKIKGIKYLFKLADQAATIMNLRDHAVLVFELARRREFIAHTTEALEYVGGKPNFDVDGQIHRLQDKFNMFSMNPQLDQVFTGTQLTKQIVESIRESHDRAKEEGVACSTGLPSLDKSLIGGLHPGTMLAIGGRTGSGKTLLACTISYNLSRQNIKHMYIAAEMGAERIYQRILARRMGKNAAAFKFRESQDKDFIKALMKANREPDDTCMFKNAPGITLEDLKREIISNTRRHNLRGVIVDYIQLIKGQRKGESKVDHIENVVQTLESIKNEEGIWVMPLAQTKLDGSFRGGDPIQNGADDAYEIKKVDLPSDENSEAAWFRHIKARESVKRDLGSERKPLFVIDKIGPHFREIKETE